MDTEKVEKLREEARQCEEAKEESFQRCDTDGFLSQWAHGITAELKRAQADLEERGNVSEKPALFDLDGNRVRAKLYSFNPKHAPWATEVCWAFCDEQGKFTGKFITAFPKRASTMEKKGYREGKELAPCEAKIVGKGHGLSGSAWVSLVRTDRGYPESAI